MQKTPAHLAPKQAFSVDEFAYLNGVCRQTVYSLINNGKLRSYKIGARRLISAEAARDFRQSMESEAAA